MTLENLTPIAEADFQDILLRSRSFGAIQARQTFEKLVKHFSSIEQGKAIGRKHHVVPHPDAILCITEPPFVIFFNRQTRMVLRVIDGRRDLRDILASI